MYLRRPVLRARELVADHGADVRLESLDKLLVRLARPRRLRVRPPAENRLFRQLLHRRRGRPLAARPRVRGGGVLVGPRVRRRLDALQFLGRVHRTAQGVGELPPDKAARRAGHQHVGRVVFPVILAGQLCRLRVLDRVHDLDRRLARPGAHQRTPLDRTLDNLDVGARNPLVDAGSHLGRVHADPVVDGVEVLEGLHRAHAEFVAGDKDDSDGLNALECARCHPAAVYPVGQGQQLRPVPRGVQAVVDFQFARRVLAADDGRLGLANRRQFRPRRLDNRRLGLVDHVLFGVCGHSSSPA